MSLRKRSLYSLILITMILVVVFLFYAAGIRITGRIIKSRIEVGDLYKEWLLCKYELLDASFGKNKQEKLLKLKNRINDLDGLTIAWYSTTFNRTSVILSGLL